MSQADHFFAYGTLEIPEVMQAVTGRRFEPVDARLPDHARHMLAERIYPGVVPEPGAETTGCLYRDLDADSFAALDRFEGRIYTRRRLSVRTNDGAACDAFVYVLNDAERHLLRDEQWSRERFREIHLHDYLRACRAFRAEELAL